MLLSSQSLGITERSQPMVANDRLPKPTTAFLFVTHTSGWESDMFSAHLHWATVSQNSAYHLDIMHMACQAFQYLITLGSTP